MVECYFMSQSDNGSITETHPLRQWSNRYMQSLEGLKSLRMPLRMEEMFRAADLIDVEVRMIPLPLCGWPSGVSSFAVVRAGSHDIVLIRDICR